MGIQYFENNGTVSEALHWIYLALNSFFELVIRFNDIPQEKIETEVITEPSLLLRIKFNNIESSSQSQILKIMPNSTYLLEGPRELEILVGQLPSPEEVASVENTAEFFSDVNSAGGTSTEALSSILALSSLDSSGVMMKFSQMSKLFSRYRMINLNFGTLLNAHFSANAKKYDKRTDHSDDYIWENSYNFKAKFSSEFIPLSPFEVSPIKIIIFFIISMIKMLYDFLIEQASISGKISKKLCYFIHFG